MTLNKVDDRLLIASAGNYKTIILPVVLYECETSSLALREEHRLRMFGNRVLRRIFEPKWGGNGRRLKKTAQ
jgi:hypothetical protein